ncbi:hypothetical protein Tco_0600630 [Tanacetum coccineum]
MGETMNKDEVSQLVVQKRMMESYVPPILFPGKVKKEKEKEQFRKFFKNLQQLSIDNLFVEALEKIPKYAKFMKDLLMNKEKFKEASKETLLKDQLDSFLFEPIRGFQPSKDINLWEHISENQLQMTHITGDLGLSNTKPELFSYLDDSKNLTLFVKSTTYMEKLILKLKELPSHLEYAFLDGNQEFPVIISSLLSHQEKGLLLQVLSKHKSALAWKVSDIKGISPSFCTHKVLLEDNFKPVVQPQRRLNTKVQDVVKAKIVKQLDAGLIYAISDSPWISPIHVMPKKGGMAVITNEKNKLVPTKTVMRWRVCIDYRKLNDATRKTIFHYPSSIKC